jgi:Protein of unknown function (DUF1761)
MTDSQVRVQPNYLAILVAAIANFLLEAGWYTLFMKTWLSGTGHSMEWLVANGVSPALQYATALASAAVMALAISCVIQATGPQTAWRGIKAGALLWLGFELTALSTDYIFEVRPFSLFAVDAGFWLFGMVIMGAIVGAWKKK